MDTVARFSTLLLALMLCLFFLLYYAQQKEACRFCGGGGGTIGPGFSEQKDATLQCGCTQSEFTSWIQSTVIQRCTVTATSNETTPLLKDWEEKRRKETTRTNSNGPTVSQASSLFPQKNTLTTMKMNMDTTGTKTAKREDVIKRVTVIERQESPLKLFCSLAYFTFSVWRITGVLF